MTTTALVAFSISWPVAAIIIAFFVFLAVAAGASSAGSGKAMWQSLGSEATTRHGDLLEQVAADLADVRTRLGEVERLLKEV